MKAILIVGDGLADRPIPELKNKTPLEMARKPSLNKIAEIGICGIMDPIAPGIPPGSDTATLALLGYDPREVYSGRGALEALGSGVDVLPQDVVFRCNFATVDENLNVVDRRAGRIETSDSSKLAQAFKKIVIEDHRDVQITFKNTVQHRAILRLRGPKLSRRVSDSDPQKTATQILTVNPCDDTPEAKKTADIVNKFTRYSLEILKSHTVNAQRVKEGLLPANAILCRGAGKLPVVTPISLRYGIRAAAVSVMPLIRGVCKAAGCDLLDVKGATGTYDTDAIAKAKTTVKALKTHDFVFLHVKATDVASHDGKAEQKIRMIEKIDGMAGYILKKVGLDETFIAVTADHTTSLVTREHEGDPVPVAITGPGIRTDDVKEFDERNCAKGGLGRIRGKDLMPIIINLMGKAKKFGA
mgnify:CR=1 FL=1